MLNIDNRKYICKGIYYDRDHVRTRHQKTIKASDIMQAKKWYSQILEYLAEDRYHYIVSIIETEE